MDISKIKLVYYSPTGTGKRTVEAIRKGMGIDYDVIDLTPAGSEMKNHAVAKDELAIIAAPVYSGRIPAVAAERVRTVKGDGSPAVLVAVYGNREFEDALIELKDITEELGFKTVAGSAFIGQHSFDSEETPIATNRPDGEDVKKAMDFGAKVMEKVKGLGEIPDLEVPGDRPYRKSGGGDPRSPETDPDSCILCGMCARMCPTGCVEVSDLVETDKEKCTACTACVQNCPTGARHWKHEGILGAAKWLATNFGARKEPEFFL
ncbi:4Fe-4S binding protein [Candidatus Bathyarchaeota archaeon]|jgi:ferredoxin|nr:4Fe-4S binding protein [Candidatus Bathyarchaeota archaeon]MBT4423574.1 4Fe-4S binding protein [Candidatus Bathyarchaeota archaeon]MBT5643194.1 4Fe-4S binding protein [Candidatus Bathyarchaeota archaeon]MBT6605089.1 4Fe-4S binding protein [Candidatus Bathyarchaeota archaeon]MBT7188497.1 4Fe-4S binding protein [Candidatus Bathyarchaeota archaeon]